MDCPSDYFNPETTPDESIFDRENFENENSVSLGTIEGNFNKSKIIVKADQIIFI